MKFRILRVRLIVPFMSRRKIKNDLWKYRLLHVKCRLILISNLNLIGLFSTELQRCGKRDIENEIDDWDLRLNKCWQAVHIDCYRWPVGSFLGIYRLAKTVKWASNVGKGTTLISFDPHCLYAYHCMSACAQWRVCMHISICVRMYAVLVCNMLYVYVGHTTGRECIRWYAAVWRTDTGSVGSQICVYCRELWYSPFACVK